MRRAWIEIKTDISYDISRYESLSVRRAWIEIIHCMAGNASVETVALREESVD